MNEEQRKNPLIWGVMLLVCALGCVSLRNNPALGISPLAIGIIEAGVYICIMTCVRLSDWRLAALIAIATPVYLWMMQFLDAFMIPIDILANLTMMICMILALKLEKNSMLSILLLALPAFMVLLLGETVVLWILKQEGIVRAVIVAWNTCLYSGFSMLGAALLCVPYRKNEARS